MIRMKLSVAAILVSSISAMAFTQNAAPGAGSNLTARVENILKQREPEWKPSILLSTKKRVVTRWAFGNEEVIVSIYEFQSADEAATEMFKAIKAIPIGGEPLDKLGDSAYVWAGYTESGRSAIRFRKSNVFVAVSAPSLKLAKKFARHIADEIESR